MPILNNIMLESRNFSQLEHVQGLTRQLYVKLPTQDHVEPCVSSLMSLSKPSGGSHFFECVFVLAFSLILKFQKFT